MGSFGLFVSQDEWQIEPEPLEPQGPVSEGKRRETAIDRVLAYLSFYVLVFAAFCAFLPVQTGAALAYVQEINPIAMSKPPLLKREIWQFRGTKTDIEGWTIRKASE